MIVKVGVYCRLSDEDRDKKNVNDDSDSIQNQKSMLLKYAIQNDWDVIDIYSDDDYSGAGAYRPDFERMINDCESGRINLVLCKTQSRFSRDMEVIEKYIHNKFALWGVRFVSIVDNADTEVKGNKKARQINGLINEWFLEDLSDNIKKSLSNKRDDGLFMGSFAPYGYIKDPENKHKLIIDEIPAEVVRKIFEHYKNGYSYYKICQILNREKIDTPSIYKRNNGSKFVCCGLDYSKAQWNVDTIARMLRNHAYVGNLVQGKRTSISYKIHKSRAVEKEKWSITENAHEPIIDIDTWLTVQERLGKHESPTRTGEIHFFSQKVYCNECRKIFMRNVYKVKGGKRSYMQCKGAKKYHNCDNRKAVRIDLLENAVIKEMNLQFSKFYNQPSLERQYPKVNNKAKYPDRISACGLEKAKIERQIHEKNSYYKGLYEDKVKKIISEDEFIMLRDTYLQDIEVGKKRIKALDEEIKLVQAKADRKDNIISIIEKYKQIDRLNKIILDEFVSKIYIGDVNEETKERDIIIEWNFAELAM
ncbi:MAG: recombinase family protein [Defluviitaleaceae bacterium]|nr:recombinase family protein [Defluviitaleaceae bacterium]